MTEFLIRLAAALVGQKFSNEGRMGKITEAKYDKYSDTIKVETDSFVTSFFQNEFDGNDIDSAVDSVCSQLSEIASEMNNQAYRGID